MAQEVNDEGALVILYGKPQFAYCARKLGLEAIPGSDGQCGPDGGPPCASCKRFLRLKRSACPEAFWEVTATDGKIVRFEVSPLGCSRLLIDSNLVIEDVPCLQFDPSLGKVMISNGTCFTVPTENCLGEWPGRGACSSDLAECMTALGKFCASALIPFENCCDDPFQALMEECARNTKGDEDPLFKPLGPDSSAAWEKAAQRSREKTLGLKHSSMEPSESSKTVIPGACPVAGFTGAKKASADFGEQDSLLCALADMYSEATPKRWEVITAEFNLRSVVEQAEAWGKRRLKKIKAA